MLKIFTKTIILSLLAISFFYTFASPALALNIDDYSQKIADQGGYRTDITSQDYLDTVLGKTIAFALGFVGIIFFGLILVAGFQILTAGGNEENVKKAKSRIIHATIGLLIIIAAYIISYTIFTVIETSRQGGQPPEPQPGFECQNNSDCVAQCVAERMADCLSQGYTQAQCDDERDVIVDICTVHGGGQNYAYQGAQPYCANKRTYSFCTVCNEHADCSGTDKCCKTPFGHTCLSAEEFDERGGCISN